MTNYALSIPAITGGVVTQGHADYCQANGHAKHTVDGVDQGMCPRCGEFTVPESRADYLANVAKVADEWDAQGLGDLANGMRAAHGITWPTRDDLVQAEAAVSGDLFEGFTLSRTFARSSDVRDPNFTTVGVVIDTERGYLAMHSTLEGEWELGVREDRDSAVALVIAYSDAEVTDHLSV